MICECWQTGIAVVSAVTVQTAADLWESTASRKSGGNWCPAWYYCLFVDGLHRRVRLWLFEIYRAISSYILCISCHTLCSYTYFLLTSCKYFHLLRCIVLQNLASMPTVPQHLQSADDGLFGRVTNSNQHLHHYLLPFQHKQHCCLHEPSHNYYQHPERTSVLSDKNFLMWMLYKEPGRSQFSYCHTNLHCLQWPQWSHVTHVH